MRRDRHLTCWGLSVTLGSEGSCHRSVYIVDGTRLHAGLRGSEGLLAMRGCGADYGCMWSTCCLHFPKTIHKDAIESKRSGSRSEGSSEGSRRLRHVN